MGTLFEIVNEFEELYELATDPLVDSEAWETTLEALTGELEVKSAGYVNVIKQLEMEAKQAKEISKQFADKQKTRENHIKQMKEALLYAMQNTGMEKLEAGDFTIKIQNNGGVQPLAIDGAVPDSYNKLVIEPDSELIRRALEEGKELDFAHLEPRGKHIVIK